MRSIAEGRPATPSRVPVAWSAATVVAGFLVALAALVLYALANPEHYNQYTHFVWQADAFLHGRAWFPHPVPDGAELPANWWFQDVYPLRDAAGQPDGRVLLPFPPLPAIVLLPFVAVFGLLTDQEAIAIGLAALGVWLAFWMLGRVPVRTSVRLLATLVFATGTVWWWAAAVGSTWYLAHLVAVDVAFLAMGVALGADARAATEDRFEEAARGPEPAAGGPWAAVWPLDRSQVLAGFLLGVAATARLPLVLAAPWLMLVGGGGSVPRRTASAAVGGAIPVAALLAYTWLTSGSLIHPGYDYQYQLEANGYPTLGYNPAWSVEDPRYVPQNLGVMLGALPVVAPEVKPDTLGFAGTTYLCTEPDARRTLFDPDCPLVMPVDIGTSILLSAPGLLLGLIAFRRRPFTRLALGGGLAAGAIALFNLAHFSQGWVQWGYRFSLDFIPFLLPLVALGAARADGRPRLIAIVLLVIGAAVNLWGVTWGQLLGW